MFKFSIADLFSDLNGFTSNFLGGEDHGLMSTDAAYTPHALSGNDDCLPDINPASGLPMINCNCGIDVSGNTYGFNDSLFD